MAAALHYTDSDRRQIQDLFRTEKLHPGYLEYVQKHQRPEVPIVVQAGSIMTLPLTKGLVVTLLGFVILISIRFSQSAQANTINQNVVAAPDAPSAADKNNAKLLLLLNAVVTQIKTQESRLVALETGHPEVFSDEQAHLAVTRIVNVKAFIRTGPSKTATPLMAISAGTRLVQIDTSGEWVQVYAPSGEVGWVSQLVLSVLPE